MIRYKFIPSPFFWFMFRTLLRKILHSLFLFKDEMDSRAALNLDYSKDINCTAITPFGKCWSKIDFYAILKRNQTPIITETIKK